MATENDSRQARLFLLGLEPDGDWEDRLFAEDALYEAVEEEREVLVEDFVNGRLSETEARVFREQCGRSPALQRRVTEHRSLRMALERRRRASKVSALPWRKRRVLGPVLAALAAGLLLAGFLGKRKPTPAAAPAARSGEASSTEVARERRSPADALAVFFLADGVTRGAATAPVLRIAPGTGEVDLQVEVRSGAPGSRWEARLVNARGQLSNMQRSEVQQAGGVSFFLVRLPVDSLPEGSYLLTFRREDAGGMSLKRAFLVRRSR